MNWSGTHLLGALPNRLLLLYLWPSWVRGRPYLEGGWADGLVGQVGRRLPVLPIQCLSAANSSGGKLPQKARCSHTSLRTPWSQGQDRSAAEEHPPLPYGHCPALSTGAPGGPTGASKPCPPCLSLSIPGWAVVEPLCCPWDLPSWGEEGCVAVQNTPNFLQTAGSLLFRQKGFLSCQPQ